MKANACSTASEAGIQWYIFLCEVGTKITYGGSNLQLSTTKLHERSAIVFFYFMATKFTLVLLSRILSKIRYSKYCILYHITYTTIEALLYQPLRFIVTFKSNRSLETGYFFPRFFMVIHFRGQGLSLRTTLLHCKDYIAAVAN